ncbi:MAG TPA: PPC domain-containing protein [Gemmatimonadales bacterium]|nr:PPC domain-containing protein [Gemmatimonadales bacterium]
MPVWTAPAHAQLSLKAALDDVLGWVNLKQADYEAIPEMGQWGMTFGWFAEGEEKQLMFAATKGKDYFIAGGGDENSEDLDICVYDPKGAKVECDTATDDVPLVTFTAAQDGTYRVVLKAYDVDGSTTFAGMVLLRKKG